MGVLRGMSLAQLRGEQGLCYEDTTCLARSFGGDLWIGTSRGAIRKTDDEYHYFGAQRWLPGDYVRDIAVGDRFVSAEATLTAAEIKAFAAQFDPQPFHLDEAAAAASFFGGLAASGWHTAALTMRLLVECMPIARAAPLERSNERP